LKTLDSHFRGNGDIEGETEFFKGLALFSNHFPEYCADDLLGRHAVVVVLGGCSPLILCLVKARETAAALMNWGRAPMMVAIFMF